MDNATKNTEQQQPINNSLNNQYTINPMLIVFLFLIIVAYIVFFSYLGNSESSNVSGGEGSKSTNIIIGVFVAILLSLFIYYAVSYYFNINLFDKLFNNDTHPVVKNKGQINDAIDNLLSNKQVFNIPENKYTYEDANALCKAYDSRLATYSDLEKSYQNGADWCKYGWSAGQMALFPTQKSTYNKLQQIKGHEHDCGRPGVNGGYIENANAQFGVNCYGNKRRIRPDEAKLMEDASPFPITNEEIQFQNKVDYWKTKINDIILSPFNSKRW